MSESRIREGKQKNRSARPSDRIVASEPLPDCCFIVIYPRVDKKTGRPIVRPDGLLSIPKEMAKAIGHLCGQRVREAEQAEIVVKTEREDGTVGTKLVRPLDGAIFRIPLNGKPLQQIERILRSNGYKGEVYRQSGRVLFGASGPEKPKDRSAARRRFAEQQKRGNLPELLARLFGDYAKARSLLPEHNLRPEQRFGNSRLGRIEKRQDESERRRLLPKPDGWPEGHSWTDAIEVCPQVGAIWNALTETVQAEIDTAVKAFIAAGLPRDERMAWIKSHRSMRLKPFLDWLDCPSVQDAPIGEKQSTGAKGSETERDSLRAARTDTVQDANLLRPVDWFPPMVNPDDMPRKVSEIVGTGVEYFPEALPMDDFVRKIQEVAKHQ